MRNKIFSCAFLYLLAACLIAHAEPMPDALNDLPTSSSPFSAQDQNLIIQNPTTTFVYIPKEVRHAVQTLRDAYKDLGEHVDLSIFLDESTNVAPKELVDQGLKALIAVLTEANLQTRTPQDESLNIINQYENLVRAGDVLVCAEDLATLGEEEPTTRWGHNKTFRNLFVIDALTANSLSVIGRAAIAGDLSVAGEGNFSRGLTVNDNLTVSGTINGNIASNLTNVTTLNATTVKAANIEATASLTSDGTTTLKSAAPGILSTNAAGVVSAKATTNNAVQVGNTNGNLTDVNSPGSTPTSPQLLTTMIGAGTQQPQFAGLTSTTINIAYNGTSAINIETSATGQLLVHANSGPDVSPGAGNILNVLGDTTNVQTTNTAGSTLTISLEPSIVITDNITATNGDITATAGNIAATNGSVSAGTTVTANGNITSTSGNISATNGSVSAGTTVTAGGNITSNNGNVAATNGAVSAGTTVTAGGNITSNNGNIAATNGAVSAGTGLTVTNGNITANSTSGTSAGNITAQNNITADGVLTGGTIQSNGAMTVKGDITTTDGGDITAAGSITAGDSFMVTTGTVTLPSALGAGALVTSSAGVTTAAQGAGQTLLFGQGAAAGTTAPVFGSLTSSDSSVGITWSPNTTSPTNLSLTVSANFAKQFDGNSGTATPAAGILNIDGDGTTITTTASGNTVTAALVANPMVTGTLTAGNLTSSGTTTLSALTAGAVTSTSAGVLASTNGTAGQVLLSQGAGSSPTFGGITAGSSGTMTVTSSGAGITLDTVGAILSLPGTVATPKTATVVSGLVTIAGGIVSGTGFTAALSGGNIVITFSPTFSTAPMVLVTPVGTSSTAVAYVASAATTSSVSIGFAGTTAQVYFMAMSIT
jgi:hypothetical protein